MEPALDPTESEFEAPCNKLVLFGIGVRRFGVPVESVLEMTPLAELAPISEAPRWITGMMRLRDAVLPVLDLRLRLGIQSLEEERAEVCQVVRRLKQEHVDWVEGLERWYCRDGDGFQPRSCHFDSCDYVRWRSELEIQDAKLERTLGKVDEAHSQLHLVASSCIEAAGAASASHRSQVFESMRVNELPDLVCLFDELESQVRERSRKMVLVLHAHEHAIGVAVDRIESVLGYEPEQWRPPPLADVRETGGLVQAVVDADGGSPLIQVLDVPRLFATSAIEHPNDGL